MKKRIKALLLSITMLPTLSGCTLSKENVINSKEETTVVHCTTTKERTTTPYTTQQKTATTTEKKTTTTTEPKNEIFIKYYDPEETIIEEIQKGDIVITYYNDPENNTISSMQNYGQNTTVEVGPDNIEYELPGKSVVYFGTDRKIKAKANNIYEEYYNENGKKCCSINKREMEESLYTYYEDTDTIKTITCNKLMIRNNMISKSIIMQAYYYDKNNSSNYYTEYKPLDEYQIYINDDLVFTCPTTYSVRVIDLGNEPILTVKNEDGNTVFTTANWIQNDDEISETWVQNNEQQVQQEAFAFTTEKEEVSYPKSRTKIIESVESTRSSI